MCQVFPDRTEPAGPSGTPRQSAPDHSLQRALSSALPRPRTGNRRSPTAIWVTTLSGRDFE